MEPVSNIELRHWVMDYIEHSLRYYAYDQPLWPDDVYDKLCQVLLDHWDRISEFELVKRIVSKEDLEAGTGMYITPERAPAMDRAVRKFPDTPLRVVYNYDKRAR